MTNIDIKYLYDIYKDEVEEREEELMTRKEFAVFLEETIEDMIREGEI
ncbi:hypothetical protein LCGC14_2901720 [marine sediment metagenome]|uniref:Uncharacterized protein n=1 Tax=marine sediment metagenome TaxID=412755 RepID=A0A0F8XUL2_9ZZZZ